MIDKLRFSGPKHQKRLVLQKINTHLKMNTHWKISEENVLWYPQILDFISENLLLSKQMSFSNFQ